jgi:Flp pilus assembly protein TadG
VIVRHHAPAPAPAGRDRRSHGAVLVEFAIIVPLLFAILFGIVDFGYSYAKTLDIRHGSREGARLAAVNYTGGSTATGTSQTSVIIAEMCARMDGADGATVALTLLPGTTTAPAGSVGRAARVTVSRPGSSISGLYAPILEGRTVRSAVEVRLEVQATWATSTGTCS